MAWSRSSWISGSLLYLLLFKHNGYLFALVTFYNQELNRKYILSYLVSEEQPSIPVAWSTISRWVGFCQQSVTASQIFVYIHMLYLHNNQFISAPKTCSKLWHLSTKFQKCDKSEAKQNKALVQHTTTQTKAYLFLFTKAKTVLGYCTVNSALWWTLQLVSSCAKDPEFFLGGKNSG